jgi:hypothetical protein
MAQKYVNRAAGLHTFKNELTSPDGAQIIADNVVIDRDNTIESRRGFKQFLPFGLQDDRAKQLLQYKDRLITHYDDRLIFENPGFGFDAFSGSYTETEAGLRIKSVEANGNLYVTTSDGIKKIAARTGNDLSSLPGFIIDAGAYRGIDFTALPNYSENGFFTPNSNVAYRIVWGYNDINDNLVLGYPSEIVSTQNVDLKESCVVDLKISIPSQIISSGNAQNYFYQVYRSNIKTPYDAGIDVEFRLVDENFLTQDNLDDGFVDYTDNTPGTFRDAGPNLYTNEISGEGNAQANAQPPFAKDVCLFRGSVFYANTKTRHTQTTNLIAPDNFISGQTKFYIASENQVEEYTFRGVQQVSTINFTGYSPLPNPDYVNNLDGKYFLLNVANNIRKYFVWFDNVGSNEKHELDFGVSVPTEGSFTLTILGNTTRAIPYTVTASELKDFIEELPNVDYVDVTGSIDPDLSFTIEYGGSLAQTSVPLVYPVSNLLVGAAPLTITASVATAASDVTPSTSETVGRLPIRIDIKGFTTKTEVINKINSVFLEPQYAIDFNLGVAGDIITITNEEAGSADVIKNSGPISITIPDAQPLPNTIVFATPTPGLGEDTSGFFLLSKDPSSGVRLEQTTKSMVRIINSNLTSKVNAFYTSIGTDLPGQISLQAKTTEDSPFYLAANEFGDDYNPSLVTTVTPLASTTDFDDKTLTVTWTGHGMTVGTKVVLFNPAGGLVAEPINGVYSISAVNSANEFVVAFPAVIADATGTLTGFKTTKASSNEEKPNRVYFSKTDIPEAVPLLNFFDVGSKDSEIKRIIPLRDSLFVLKTEGIYRLSGSNPANFSVSLFDSSSPILAPDSAAVLNNQIYILSTQGIVAIGDGGVDIMSRNIESDIIQPTSNNFPDFSTQSFGIASETDRAYIIFLPTKTDDEVATQAFRFNIFTRAWTRWVMSKTCGIVKKSDDRIYFGAADINYIEQERKEFLRTDYADRQYDKYIAGSVNGLNLLVNSVTNIQEFDVIYQEQYITISRFNRMLQALDLDYFLDDEDYYSTLGATSGSNLGNLLSELISKVNADDDGKVSPYTPYLGSVDKDDIRDGFNLFVNELNSSAGIFNKSYVQYDTLVRYEGAITKVNKFTSTIMIQDEIPFVVGDCIVFSYIDAFIEYSPDTIGDASLGKHFSQASLLFDQFNFTFGTFGFRSDLYASRQEVLFPGDGNGDYGVQVYGEEIYGGLSNERSFRTYVPRNYQRGKYLTLSFRHLLARENFQLVGYSITHEGSPEKRFYKR